MLASMGTRDPAHEVRAALRSDLRNAVKLARGA